MKTIASLADEIRSTYVPNQNEDLLYVGMEHIEKESLKISKPGISSDVSSHKYIFKSGDSLFGTLRPYFRKVGLADFDGVCSTEFSVVRAKDSNDDKFIFYALANPSFIEYATKKSNGDRPRTKWQFYSDWKVGEFNSISRQAIGEALYNYDKLISNNQRRIELLEQAARMIYKEWFVRFRFPGHEHVKMVDGIPEGWQKKNLKSVADLTMGQSPKSEFYNDHGDGLPFHQGVTNYGFRYVEDMTYSRKTTKLAEAGSILFSVRAPVGRINLTLNKIVLGRGVAAINSTNDSQSFLFYALKEKFFKEDLIGGGAIYASVTKKDMEKIEIIYPDSVLLRDFENIAIQIDLQIKNLTKTNHLLVKARDILLPRLMNGTLQV